MFLGISDRPRKARLDQSGLHHLRKQIAAEAFHSIIVDDPVSLTLARSFLWR
jgi:hypothetical protein